MNLQSLKATELIKKVAVKYTFIVVASTALFSACTDPSSVLSPSDVVKEIPVQNNPTDTATQTSNGTSEIVTEEQETIMWSGRKWRVRNSSQFTGPGLNVFSNRRGNVWVDTDGNLHLKVTYRDGKWWSAEVLSDETFGYGDYKFLLSSRADKLDKNIVLGLFTWNNNSFQSDANSEIDIEFAKWGYENSQAVNYAVQPSNWGKYTERDVKATGFNLTQNLSTHGFSWRPTGVDFTSYYGHTSSTPASSWNFANTMQARRKVEGGRTSDAVVIPKPGTLTRVHINLWLNDTNNDGYGDAPSNGQEAEVILKGFEYTAY
ncbi:MAG TPA: hypothetical protein VEC36_13645 [Patescibacteria group bacterium]|nr:hypothetical protein [Patescibacteria group bacterium]